MNYPFSGWHETPLELFDAGRWPECLHATIQAFNVRRDAIATQAAVEDTGALHELAHLACGIEICTHHSLLWLRREIAWTDLISKRVRQ